jgi:periplasmic divalent cation tolerance protein
MTTLPDEEQAKALARILVTRKLAACINILPKMTSIYEWQGKLEQGEEHLLIIKTEQNRLAELQETIKEAHPYELPEIIVVPIVGGYEPYLNWISNSVKNND